MKRYTILNFDGRRYGETSLSTNSWLFVLVYRFFNSCTEIIDTKTNMYLNAFGGQSYYGKDKSFLERHIYEQANHYKTWF